MLEKAKPGNPFSVRTIAIEAFDPRFGVTMDLPVVDLTGAYQYTIAGELIVVSGYTLQATFFRDRTMPVESLTEHSMPIMPWAIR
jgi:hypothetical protein